MEAAKETKFGTDVALVMGMMPELRIHAVHRKHAMLHSTMKTNGNIIECYNNTHQGVPCTGKQTCACTSDLGDDQSRYLLQIAL